jgi:NitT/TauT family transport system ATP-binding protein
LLENKIKIVNVTKVFETHRQTIIALENASLEVSEGEFVALIGPSGCGKSTIIRMLDDITKPTSGEIYINGEQIPPKKKISKEQIRQMGFIFQQPNLLPWLTVRQNVELPLKTFKLKGEKWTKNVDRLLAMVNLTEYQNGYPNEISGGMIQRIGVIRAMVHDPEILLMDEPFGALDEMTRELLDMELLDIWSKTKKTIVFITHNVEEAILMASKVYVMGTSPGRIIAEVPIDLERPRRLNMLTDKKFIEYEKKLTDLIGEINLSKIK